MRKYALLSLGALLCTLVSFAQLYSYTTATTGVPASVAANTAGGPLTRVNGATAPGSPCGTGFSVTGFSNAASFSTALPAVSVQVQPVSGYRLSVTGFSVALRRSGTGPASVRLAYSTDGGTTWIDKGTNDAPNNGSCNATATATWTFGNAVDVSNPTTGLLFRIFGFGASSASGTFQVLNLVVNGTAVPACTAPSNQPTALSLTPSLNSISGSFSPAAAGTTPADAYLVLISTSPTLSQLPEQGTVYAVDDLVGNARVLAASWATSFTAASLTPGTTYYFFVFSTAASTNCYNTTAPLSGSISTNAPPACTAPNVVASALTAPVITGSSIQVDYTRGNGDNVLILARANSAVNEAPVNSVSYAAGEQIGAGNYVIYNGPASSFTYTGLAQNTAYHFALYEYNNANVCYATSALTGSFTTACATALNVSSLAATTGNGQATLRWNNPAGTCLDEVIVVLSSTPITGAGNSYSGSPTPHYNGSTQVIYTGGSNTVTATNLVNGTVYYAKVFSRKGSNYSGGVQVSFVPYDPASGYVYLYGTLHAHSSYSDGNKGDLTKTPKDDFEFARDANCMDFLGISEHNHAGAGMQKSNYALGHAQADEVNGVVAPSGNSIITAYGMEWGVISGGGHVLVYGYGNQLIGWEAGNYDVFCAKSDYPSLWNLLNNHGGAFATLAHPSSSDYSNLASAYNATADNAVVGMAVATGPATSQSTAYNDFPSSLGYLTYYKNMLARGYRLGAQMDADNHYMTFGRVNTNRMVVMATARNRAALLDGIRNMRFYASEDCNVRVDYKVGTTPMGGALSKGGAPDVTVNVTDPDAGESVGSVEIWGGPAGGAAPSAPLKTVSSAASAGLAASDAANVQPNNTTWYYFAIITQADGNRIVTSPVWYTRNDNMSLLPVALTSFTAAFDNSQKNVNVLWTTAQEINSLRFDVERSADGSTWEVIGAVQAAANSSTGQSYRFVDRHPLAGVAYYRLKEVDANAAFRHSKVVTVRRGSNNAFTVSVYPNPAKDFVQINATVAAQQAVTIQLIDAAGRTVLQTQKTFSPGQTATVPLKGLNAGLYLLKLTSGTQEAVERIIIAD